MDAVLDLTQTLETAMQDYHEVEAFEATSYFALDRLRQIYLVIDVPDFPRPFSAGVVVMARVVGEYVVIDEDTTDRPLYEELLRLGIPRERIILGYAGESLPS